MDCVYEQSVDKDHRRVRTRHGPSTRGLRRECTAANPRTARYAIESLHAFSDTWVVLGRASIVHIDQPWHLANQRENESSFERFLTAQPTSADGPPKREGGLGELWVPTAAILPRPIRMMWHTGQSRSRTAVRNGDSTSFPQCPFRWMSARRRIYRQAPPE